MPIISETNVYPPRLAVLYLFERLPAKTIIPPPSVASNVTQPHQHCFGFQTLLNGSRRQILQAGALSMLGLGLERSLRPAFGGSSGALPVRAKRCIFLFMWGGPSQLDTFDMKPGAPAEIRGEFKPISTAVPGIQICEHFSKLSKLSDRFTILRSLAHD
ncbi:MAG: DUF1501 domain-containing protein, partial [Pirellula sp.]